MGHRWPACPGRGSPQVDRTDGWPPSPLYRRAGQNPAYRPAHRHYLVYLFSVNPYYIPTKGVTEWPARCGELSPSKQDGSRRWEMRVYVGRDPDKTIRDEDGRVVKQGPPVHASKVFRGGKRAALKALDRFVAETGQDRHIGSTATVGKLLTEWLTDLERLGKARSTLETYQTHVEKHIRPALDPGASTSSPPRTSTPTSARWPTKGSHPGPSSSTTPCFRGPWLRLSNGDGSRPTPPRRRSSGCKHRGTVNLRGAGRAAPPSGSGRRGPGHGPRHRPRSDHRLPAW